MPLVASYSFWTWPGWSAIVAIATCALVFGVVAAAWAIKDARRATQLAAAIDLLREYRSDELRDARRRIGNLPPFDPQDSRRGFDQFAIPDREIVERLSNFLDNIGVLVAQKLLTPEPAAAFFGGSARAMWIKLAPYIYDERGRPGRRTYQRHFEDFVYRLSRMPFEQRIDELGVSPPADAELRKNDASRAH